MRQKRRVAGALVVSMLVLGITAELAVAAWWDDRGRLPLVSGDPLDELVAAAVLVAPVAVLILSTLRRRGRPMTGPVVASGVNLAVTALFVVQIVTSSDHLFGVLGLVELVGCQLLIIVVWLIAQLPAGQPDPVGPRYDGR